jgi:prolyl-tRNA synthetase
MKDAYSFDSSWENLDLSYKLHDKAYRKIFDGCDLKYFIVGASSGAMGGTGSEEFMVKSDAGEDTVAHCSHCGYAANVEIAESKVEIKKRDEASNELKEFDTPNVKSIMICAFLKLIRPVCKIQDLCNNNEPVLVLMLGMMVNENGLPVSAGISGPGIRMN